MGAKTVGIDSVALLLEGVADGHVVSLAALPASVASAFRTAAAIGETLSGRVLVACAGGFVVRVVGGGFSAAALHAVQS
jgi:hypothetical protein